uniref:Uncharacterized protein n=1 Tax=Arundo donax TaxID=35708 RepID=A0A0A9EXK0_ARUDO
METRKRCLGRVAFHFGRLRSKSLPGCLMPGSGLLPNKPCCRYLGSAGHLKQNCRTIGPPPTETFHTRLPFLGSVGELLSTDDIHQQHNLYHKYHYKFMVLMLAMSPEKKGVQNKFPNPMTPTLHHHSSIVGVPQEKKKGKPSQQGLTISKNRALTSKSPAYRPYYPLQLSK